MNVPNLLRKSIKEGTTGLEDVFIGNCLERMESMLSRNGISINQKQLLRMTILLDFTVQTDHFITARSPDVILIDKKHCDYQIVDFTIPYDTRIDQKEVEKTKKYLYLATELKKVWNMKVTVFPLVVGAVGRPAKALEKRLKAIGVVTNITELQRTVLIHTSRIFKRF